MIQPIGTASVPTIQNPSTYKSNWNSVHNSAIFKFQRKDIFPASFFSYGATTPSKLAFAIADAIVLNWSVGDDVYVPTYDKVVKISLKDVNYNGAGETRIVLDLDFTTANGIGFINNLTYYYGWNIEFRVVTYDSFTDEPTTHESFSCYPSNNGIVTMQPHGYAIRELQKVNKSYYALTNWNDRYAWCKYRVEMRERYVNQNTTPQYYPIEATTPSVVVSNGTEYVFNNDFSQQTNGWGLSFMQINPVNSYGLYEIQTQNINTTSKELFCTMLGNLVAGQQYQILLGASLNAFQNVGSMLMEIIDYNTNIVIWSSTTPFNGYQTITFTAPANNISFFFRWSNNSIGSVWKFSVTDYIVTTNPNIDLVYYYATNSVRQIQSRLGTNMCEHLCVYSNIPVVTNRGKFISDFVRPTKFKGYPFDIAFIMHESMEGGRARSVEEWYDFNGANPTINYYPLIDYSRGEHRLILKSTFADTDTSVDVWIEAESTILRQYVDTDYVVDGYIEPNAPASLPPLTSILMQKMNVKLDSKCKENPVYIAWKGRKGGMNYWLFSKTQTIGSTIGSPSKYEPYYDNLQIEGRSSVLTKSDSPTMVVGADNIDLNDVQGLVGLSVSNFVQMYIGDGGKAGKIWQTINVKEGSFKYYETENGRHRVEYTLELVENYVHTL